jgi:DNA-binding transcriptional LysR family regulator
VFGDFKGPDEWQCRVFIAVAETHGADAAAKELRDIRPGYGRQAVEKILRRLEQLAGATLLARHPDRKLYPTGKGQEFLEIARHVVAQYQRMRDDASGPTLPVLACLPHHMHFVSSAEDLLYGTRPEETDKVLVDYVPESERGEGGFRRHAVAFLRDNRYQLIIGPRVEEPKVFESTTLYYSQLEAMVGRAFPGAEISLTDLVRNHRMLVPPRDMRSRALLEESIRDWGIEDPGTERRVAAETYETATSVMRIRNEQWRRGRADSRVVVVPSDVALAYKEGMEFGGRHAERFKWVPIYHRDSLGKEHLLRMEVCVTIREGRTDLRPIVDALTTAVRLLNDVPHHDGLAGAPFRGQRPPLIPAQRTGPARAPVN